jgi:hypothetical protein
VIEAHHLNSATQRFACGSAARGKGSVTVAEMEAELAKCIPLCSNCHIKLHELT